MADMKVLITTDWYKPAINGVVTSVLSLRAGLEKMGHEVRILTLSGDRHSRREGCVTFVGSAGAGKIYPGARFLVTTGRSYIRDIVEWHPDVIHSQCEFFTYFLARRISKMCGCPIVHTYHTDYEDYTSYFCPSKKMGKRLAALYSRMILRTSDEVIVPTEKIKNLLGGYGIKTPVSVIPSGLMLGQFRNVDMKSVEELREKYGIGRDMKVLVYLGRLAKEKRVDELLRLVSAQSNPGIRLLVVGDGPYRSRLQEQAENMNIADRVIFTGMAEPSEVTRYYKLGDIFVSASQSETQGLTYIEAMASGLPLLCREDTCLKGVIRNGITGYTYSSGEEFASRLETMIENPEYMKNMGENAEKAAFSRYSETAFAEKAEAVYKRAIAEHRIENEVQETRIQAV